MNKIVFITTIALFSQFAVSAQDLATRIPHDAFAVASINGDHFFELMDVADFNTSALGRKLLDAIGNDSNLSLSSIEDLGIDIHAATYYYAYQTDSIWYNIFLLPLKDAGLFARRLAPGKEIVAERDSYRLATDSASQGVSIRWNDRLAVIGVGSLVDGFFEEEEVMARYGITQPNYSDTYAYGEADDRIPGVPYDEWGTSDWEPDTAYWEPDPGVAADAAADLDSLWEESLQDTTDAYNWDDDSVWDSYDDDDSSWDTYDYDDSGYWETYETNRRQKDSLNTEWVFGYVTQVFSEAPAQHILTNPSYRKSRESGTLAAVWIPDLGLMYDQFILAALGHRNLLTSPIGLGSLQAGVYADKEGMKLKTSLEVSGDLARSYDRIYNRKINRKFQRYLDSENTLGFFAYSINTQAYLEEFPKILSNLYMSSAGPNADEVAIGTEILSLLLDEAAIAKTVKGDGLFVLNGVTQHETAYTSYDYDEDYNLIEVEKTKTETIPDFLLMFSSDNPDLYQRLMTYAVHKGAGTFDSGVYTLSNRRLPISLFVTHKNGIIFLGTARAQLEAIAANRFAGNANRLHRKLLRKNQVSGYLNARRALERVPPAELAALEEHFQIRQLFGHLGNFYFQSGRMKRNTISGEFVAQTPDDFNNALHYMMGVVGYAMDMY